MGGYESSEFGRSECVSRVWHVGRKMETSTDSMKGSVSVAAVRVGVTHARGRPSTGSMEGGVCPALGEMG